jgi:hypothetical protein
MILALISARVSYNRIPFLGIFYLLICPSCRHNLECFGTLKTCSYHGLKPKFYLPSFYLQNPSFLIHFDENLEVP